MPDSDGVVMGDDGARSTDPAAAIAQLQAEIKGLHRRIEEDRFAQDLRDALTISSATGTIAAPIGYQDLLEMIAATAADIVDADAAALFLMEARHLALEAAFGAKLKPRRDVHVLHGQGVVGLVAKTGHPMAISDADDEVRENAYISQTLGYPPENLLCVPLSFHDRVIGVMAVMDKKGDSSFSMGDMESIAMFAHFAAVAIEQHRTESRLAALLVELVRTAEHAPDGERQDLADRARAFTSNLSRESGYLRALELANLVQEIVQHGEAAAKACKAILNAFAHFLRSHPVSAEEFGGISW